MRPVGKGDHQWIVVVTLVFLLNACTAIPPVPSITPVPTPTPAWIGELEGHGQAGLRFLKRQYNADLGLLQESPSIGASRYFLANDALLAARVLALYGEAELAADLAATLAAYGIEGNDFIEVAWGRPIPWPPKHFADPGTPVATVGDAQILTIRHDGPGTFYDWSAYANLACMAAVNEYNQGYTESARRLYEIQLSTFDGHGFPDLAYDRRGGVYETLGIAWCVYASALVGTPDKRLVDVLLTQQDPATGGFHTHYRAAAPRLADPNVETTALALWALHAIQSGPPPRSGFSPGP